MKRLILPVFVSGLALSACDRSAGQAEEEAVVQGGAERERPSPVRPTRLAIEWQPVAHSGSGAYFVSELVVENRGSAALSSGWHLYFNFVRRILNDGEGDAAAVQDLAGQGIRAARADAAASGDYVVIEPLDGFAPLRPGERRTFTILAENWAVLKSDAPAGFHVSFDGSSGVEGPFAVPAAIHLDAADPAQTTRFGGDRTPVETPALRHAENPAFQALGLADRILPSPRRVDARAGEVVLRGDIDIRYEAGLRQEARYLASAIHDATGMDTSVREVEGGSRPRGDILLSLEPNLDINRDGQPDSEAYLIALIDDVVDIRGTDPAGVFYGIQTLRQLVPPDPARQGDDESCRSELRFPAGRIADVPGFSYRGMHLDVARHFQSVETVEKLLDLMAHYKLNKFHIHLTDDEGWRLEIPGIPELTGYGGRRGHDLAERDMLHMGLGSGSDLDPGDRIRRKPADEEEANGGDEPAYQGFENATVNLVGQGSGFYTTRDFERILAYAAERHIDVIPEIDVPGHARAAVLSMEARFRRFQSSDPDRAAEFRLIDPDDTSVHTSVQGYTDNFMNPCLESTYAFLAVVVRELEARYDAVPGARLVAIHAGGDELPGLAANTWWQGSPLCAENPATRGLSDPELFNLFFTRWHEIITATGAAMTGWDDIIHNGLDLDGFLPMPWSNVWGWGREDDAYRYANQGYGVILSHATNLYMDLSYNKDPDEPGYYWANFVDEKKTFEYRPFDIFANATEDRMGNPIDPATWAGKERLTAAGRANILGMHGLLWGENLKTPEIVEYLAFPKVLGVAERAWNPEPPPVAEMPAAWARFANRLGQHILPRLGDYRPVDLRGELSHARGVNYRIPLPGAVVASGTLEASVRYPGLAIEYSTSRGRTWQTYDGPVAVSGRVALRTRAPDGRTSRIAWVE